MAKKRYGSLVHEKRVAKNAKRIKDRINFSDIPESTNEELKRARRVGRPITGSAKQLIAIRLSPVLLKELKRLAQKQERPYQSLIHDLLEKAVKKAA